MKIKIRHFESTTTTYILLSSHLHFVMLMLMLKIEHQGIIQQSKRLGTRQHTGKETKHMFSIQEPIYLKIFEFFSFFSSFPRGTPVCERVSLLLPWLSWICQVPVDLSMNFDFQHTNRVSLSFCVSSVRTFSIRLVNLAYRPKPKSLKNYHLIPLQPDVLECMNSKIEQPPFATVKTAWNWKWKLRQKQSVFIVEIVINVWKIFVIYFFRLLNKGGRLNWKIPFHRIYETSNEVFVMGSNPSVNFWDKWHFGFIFLLDLCELTEGNGTFRNHEIGNFLNPMLSSALNIGCHITQVSFFVCVCNWHFIQIAYKLLTTSKFKFVIWKFDWYCSHKSLEHQSSYI